MLFDPSKRENLPPLLKTGIGQVMQYSLIDEIFSANVWTAKDVVFHGGTSIHVVWNSPRYSEDLDFMISVDRADDIERVMERAARSVQGRLTLSLPGSEIRVKAPKADPGVVRDVLKYEFVWSHPRKIGVVKVKVEFYTVEPQHIENYKREIGRHKVGEDAKADMWIRARPELADFDLADLKVKALIPAAHPESIYGDKLVALAKRPYLKNRDFFDLWWLNTQLGVELGDQALYEAMRRSADCYAYADTEMIDGLRRFQETPPTVVRDLEENLKAFLHEAFHRKMVQAGAFEQMYHHAMLETGRLLVQVELRVGPEIRL